MLSDICVWVQTYLNDVTDGGGTEVWFLSLSLLSHVCPYTVRVHTRTLSHAHWNGSVLNV
jgi:hypothetical protein